MRRSEIRDAEKRNKGCGEEKTLYFGATVVKLIFHCNANPFVLGPRVGLDSQCKHFVLGIPTCWYLKSLADLMPTPAYPIPTPADPTRAQRQQV